MFAHHFRTHAIPALRRQIEKLAFFIVCDLAEFDEAYDELACLADKFGRWNLPPGDFVSLNEWMLASLTEAVAVAKSLADCLAAESERRRIADPVAYYEDLAQRCAKPDAMRWVFAAISPEYRHHLQKEADSNGTSLQARRAKRAALAAADAA